MGLVYFFPPVHQRLSWRLDFARAYFRGVVDPIEAPPTALPNPEVVVNNHATSTPTTTPHPSATPTQVYTPTPLPSPTPLPQKIALDPPGWEYQDINNCGPAALAMYLRYYGWEGDQHTIADALKSQREDRNVNVEELAYFVRTNAGWLNFEYRVGGDLDLLKQFLAAGIPVMIEESFYFEGPYWPNDDLWAAQYWQAFNRVYILIYLPHQEETVKAILGPQWNPDYNRQQALEAAQAETESDPEDTFAWFNLGSNLTYFERYIEATDAYNQARDLGFPQRMLRYQFSPLIAYFHSGQIDDLLALTEYALKITPNSEEALLWHGWAMYRQGNNNDALANFRQALIENSNYLDAQYAIDFLGAN
jgi:tetratricopeptide (TPR) repeat protein